MVRHVGIVALYALAVGVVVGLFASLFVPVMTMLDPATLLILTGVITFVVAMSIALLYELQLEPGEDVEDLEPGRGRLLLVPFAMAVVASAPAILVPEYERVTRTAFSGVSPPILEATVPTLSLAAVVFVALPLAARHNAWQRIGTVTVNSANHGDPLPEESSEKGISAAFDVTVPHRAEVVEFDAKKPAIYVVDDGRRAVIGLTSGALDVLTDRELDAVLAREVARVVERAAVGPFWACTLALAVGDVLDLVTTESYDARAAGKVRLPYWFVGPLKTGTAVAGVFLITALYLWALASHLPVSGLLLAAAYAISILPIGFGFAHAGTRLAHSAGTAHVVAADEHGAVLADDATALASALRTLDESDRAPSMDTDHERTLGPLNVLADCPTDSVPLENRLDALDDVADRLDERLR